MTTFAGQSSPSLADLDAELAARANSADLSSQDAGKGASLVGVNDSLSWFAAVVTKTVESLLGWIGGWMWGRDVNVFQYLTVAEIASVKAYNFSVDVTASVQAAINAAQAGKRNCFAPAGGYLLTGITIPGSGTSGASDTRSQNFRIYGQGAGHPYSTLNNNGTIFKSVTNAPILQDATVTLPSNIGDMEIDHIRFDGNSSTSPLVLIRSLCGNSSFHHCTGYQRGAGNGFEFNYIVTAKVHDNYVFNRDFVTTGLGASRVGVGFKFAQGYGGGLPVIDHNSARGFKDCYIIDGVAGGQAENYSPSVHHNECSTFYNGITITAEVNKAWVHHNYMESCDGGYGIDNKSNYCTIDDNLLFGGGYLIGIKDDYETNTGSSISRNVINTGNKASATHISVGTSLSSNGSTKVVCDNELIYTLGTTGVTGIKVTGLLAQVTYRGNNFNPKGGWTGSGTKEIYDQTTSGIGVVEYVSGSSKIPVLKQCAIYLKQGGKTLTESDVSANVLTLPDDGSFFVITPTTAVTINNIIGNANNGRVLHIRATNNLVTFANAAYCRMPGGTSWTSGTAGGILQGILLRIGADNYFMVESTSTHS